MIQPISIQMVSRQITLEASLTCSTEKAGDKVQAEGCVIDSGRLKGTMIAYIRYLSDTTDNYPWQVIHVRNDNNLYHYSTVRNLEQAMHLVTACAYEYVAFN